MFAPRSLLLVCALLPAAAGCGAAPRIAGVEGRAVPCPAALFRAATPAPGMEVAVACVTYDVEGETAEALAASMDARGPRDERGHYHGYTAFELSYGYDEREGEGACRPESVLVRIRIVHVLPALAQGRALGPGLAARWERFTERLTVHEAGHGELDVAAALRLFAALALLPPEPSCGAVRDRAHATFQGVVRGLRRDNRRYDMETAHGVEQGARFP